MFLDFIKVCRKGMYMADLVGQPQTVQVPNYSGVNIQIFNPAVNAPGVTPAPSTVNTTNYPAPPAYPANYYTQNFATTPVQPVPEASAEKKKTETREIVKLTDDYVKTLENYLNDQSNQVRLLGAKEISARFMEDSSRRNDEALNALVNKMLQDPYQPIRFMAMGLLEARAASGNNQSINFLQKLQQQKTSTGEDELKASNALLRMSGVTTKKEFDVQDKPKTKGDKE